MRHDSFRGPTGQASPRENGWPVGPTQGYYEPAPLGVAQGWGNGWAFGPSVVATRVKRRRKRHDELIVRLADQQVRAGSSSGPKTSFFWAVGKVLLQ